MRKKFSNKNKRRPKTRRATWDGVQNVVINRRQEGTFGIQCINIFSKIPGKNLRGGVSQKTEKTLSPLQQIASDRYVAWFSNSQSLTLKNSW